MLKAPDKYRGMLPNGKPFLATMYYERYYEYPKEYDLLDRDLEDLAYRGWTVAFTDYIDLSLGEVWDHYYDKAAELGLYVMPDQWNAAFHAGGPFYSRTTPPITETGAPPTGFCTGGFARYKDPAFISAMVEYQSQVLSRYINHPAYPKILGPDGEFHPVMLVIYETGMVDYEGHWLEYSSDTKAAWVEYQQAHLGKVLSQEPPRPSELERAEELVLWNEFRAEYLSAGWSAVAKGLKANFPGLYAMVSFRQHGLLEGSKSGVNAGGMGNRAIRPELWDGFDIVASEHDGDDGIEYTLAEADLMKSAAKGRLGAIIHYLDSGYKAWTARPVEYHRPWGQSEMLGSLSMRGLLSMHYGYNERDDRAGIASTGRREKDAPLWQEKACEEAADANRVFLEVAPYIYAAKPAPARVAIVMPYEAYALASDHDLALDRRLVAIWKKCNEQDVTVDWLFSSKHTAGRYKLLIVPDAPYSEGFMQALAEAEKGGTKIVNTSLDASETEGFEQLSEALKELSCEIRVSSLPAKPGVETGLLIGDGYKVDVVANHSESEVIYSVEAGGHTYPTGASADGKLKVAAHNTVWHLSAAANQ